jgi:hypothetical protein
MGTARFSGNSSYEINYDAALVRQEGNRSLVYARTIVYKLAGTGRWSANNSGNNGWASWNGGGLWNGGGFSYDFRGRDSILFWEGNWWINHNADGFASYETSSGMNLVDIGYAASGTGWRELPRIPKPPTAPRNLRPANISINNAGVYYDGPADNRGAAVTSYRADWYEINNSTNPLVWRDLGSVGYTSPQGGAVAGSFTPKPGQTYHVYVYARNSAGEGPAAVVSLTTLPAGPPGVTVSPSPLGATARVDLTPPGGASGVASYDIEYRVTGTTSATSVNSPTNSRTIEGLNPGGSYDWRARARFSGAQSVWSEWQTVRQPTPSPSVSGYFDGSMPPRGDRSFAWEGTPHASKTKAVTAGVAGWRATAPSGAVKLARVGAGMKSAHAARALVTTALTGAGLALGLAPDLASLSRVVAEAAYDGTMYVRPSKSQRLGLFIEWYDSARVSMKVDVGDVVIVAGGATERLAVYATAPTGAEYARLEVRDVSGSGWSLWQKDEYLDADGAQLTLQSRYPYFDGSTPTDRDYQYAWNGTANASSSVRSAAPPAPDTRLMDPDCPPVPLAPRPPKIDATCIDEVGTWRRYWVSIPESAVPLWREQLPSITIITGSSDARQVRVRTYENPDDLIPSAFSALEWISEQTVSYIPPKTRMVLDSMNERALATVDGDGPLPANHLLYGRDNGPATWPVLSCGVGYLMSFDVPLEAPVGAISFEVDLTTRM